MMKKEYDIDSLISEIDFSGNSFQNVGKGIFLTNKEINVLNKYKIPYFKCNSLKEILYIIEDELNSMDIIDDDLDFVASSIAERDYYQNTNK